MSMSDEDVIALMRGNEERVAAREKKAAMKEATTVATTRHILVIGCGDGGCNIATEIAKAVPEDTTTIAYNTSNRNQDTWSVSKILIPEGVDGSGKVRQYSKDTFKESAYKVLLDNVKTILKNEPETAYIIICTTADGGTGSGISPMAAKMLTDNTDVPVIVMGVLPSMSEDATAQYNTLQWQAEIEKIGVPYFLLDNNQEGIGTTPQVHSAVNEQAAKIVSLLCGDEFGNTNISIIDDRNLYMLIAQLGSRMIAAVDTTRPTSGQTLDQYIEVMLKKAYQPLPAGVRGIGVFVRGPEEMLAKLDTGVPEFQKKYGGAVLKFAHIEEANTIKIAVLLTGCEEASVRITEIKTRYDDIMDTQKQRKSVIGDLMSETENPIGTLIKKKTPDTQDFSALDL